MDEREGTSLAFGQASELAQRLRAKIAEVVFGQDDLVSDTLCCMLAGGHILMTGAPGLAKTTLVRVLARNLGLQFGRVQFTPDLLPSDIIGSEVLDIDAATGKRSFRFAPGPVFVNLLLADEINRSSPRTQSALLEAMQERAVTIAGATHPLAPPFMVLATQNPFESEGTFPLPEAQLDRFLVHTLVPYPEAHAEERLLKEHAISRLVGEAFEAVAPAEASLDAATVQALIATTKRVRVDDEIITAIKELVRSSRPEDELCPEALRPAIWYGAGPRAGLSLISVSRALALLSGSEVVRWQHIRRMAKPVLRHRLRLTAQARRLDALNQGQGPQVVREDVLIDKLLHAVEARYQHLAKGC